MPGACPATARRVPGEYKMANHRHHLLSGLAIMVSACTAEPVGDPAFPEGGGNKGDDPNCAIAIDASRELLITDLHVVEDAVRTRPAPTGSSDPRAGAWTFGRLMANIAGPNDPAALVRAWLGSWESERVINGFRVRARTRINDLLIAPWLQRSGGSRLDLAKAPFRLLAIAARIDLRDLAKRRAGEGRFIFGALADNGDPLPFTVILEYTLRADTEQAIREWASAWHGLGAIAIDDPAFGDALQTITDRFAGRNAAPDSPNGSALGQLRTAESALDSRFELREFHLDRTSGRLASAPVANTPDDSLDGTSTVTSFINANEAAVLAERYELPLRFEGDPFLGGSAGHIGFWFSDDIRNSEARHKFSLGTCDGCHLDETGTDRHHIRPRRSGVASEISRFLSGGQQVRDPFDGSTRTFGELARRQSDLKAVLCEN